MLRLSRDSQHSPHVGPQVPTESPERGRNLCQLPPGCEYVAWVDADVVFERRDWQRDAVEVLSRARLVQLFRSAYHVRSDTDAERAGPGSALLRTTSVAACVQAGTPAAQVLGNVTQREGQVPSPGMAWAARRELLEEHGWYDACVVGGGDTALACAAMGAFGQVVRLHCMNDWQRSCYLRWAQPFFARVEGSVAALEGSVFHLWHGTLADRRPAERHRLLEPFGFDPRHDLALAEQGCWRWATHKPELHQYARDYLVQRREDGALR